MKFDYNYLGIFKRIDKEGRVDDLKKLGYQNLMSKVRDVHGFPTPEVLFKDIAPALEDRDTFRFMIEELAARAPVVDKVLGIESRGFVISSGVAYVLRAGHIMARKKGKLPFTKIAEEHELEYGKGILEMHTDSVMPGDRILILDDVLATGGTAGAAVRLVERQGGIVAGLGFIIELSKFPGRRRLVGYDIYSLLGF